MSPTKMRTRRIVPPSGWYSPLKMRDAAQFVVWMETVIGPGPRPASVLAPDLRKNGFRQSHEKCAWVGTLVPKGEGLKIPVEITQEFLYEIQRAPELYYELLGRGFQNGEI